MNYNYPKTAVTGSQKLGKGQTAAFSTNLNLIIGKILTTLDALCSASGSASLFDLLLFFFSRPLQPLMATKCRRTTSNDLKKRTST